MLYAIISLAILGFLIALYTFITEEKVKTNPTFKPVCDISDRFSCTKPMKSSYANLFFFSNAIVALFYYALIIILAMMDAQNVLLLINIVGVAVSCILAYILYVKIKTICILCTALYIINISLLILVLRLS